MWYTDSFDQCVCVSGLCSISRMTRLSKKLKNSVSRPCFHSTVLHPAFVLFEWPLLKYLFPNQTEICLYLIKVPFCFSMTWTVTVWLHILAYLNDCLQPGTQLWVDCFVPVKFPTGFRLTAFCTNASKLKSSPSESISSERIMESTSQSRLPLNMSRSKSDGKRSVPEGWQIPTPLLPFRPE